MLDKTQKETLLSAARQAVTAQLCGTKPVDGSTEDDALTKPRGVFVSVYVRDELRGCTGFINPVFGLIDAVRSCAVSAATEDTRFNTVVRSEINELMFEISVLNEPHSIEDPLSIEPGTHGVIVTGNNRTGLLLPQVALNHGMTIEEFLDAACRKADLPAGEWKNDKVQVEVFTAEVFADAEQI